MKENSFVSADDIRSAFSAAMSVMYREEVPAYGTLMELVAKVNDDDGNPIEIAAVVVWQVEDTAPAMFEVDDFVEFVAIQTETNDTVLAMNQAIGKVVEISRMAEDAGRAMRGSQQETGALASTVRDIARTSTDQAMVGAGLQERARIIQEASAETARQLALQSGETRRLVEYARSLFEQRFDARGHVVVLENNAATATTQPLASWTNLHRALDAIAKKIDPAQDIVLLYLTTHGSQGHELLVDLDPLPLNQIGPDDVADALKTTPSIRWKVVVVNACYSGGFVDALRDDSTLVLTSARADRTSFGCGADSDITYFGKAFLVDALNRTTSLREAFDLARKSVAQWEDEDAKKDASVEHSEPQIATSPSIEARLARWSAALPQAPTVEFKPAAPAQDE